MDVGFWPASISEVIKCQPQTVDELKSVVEDWAANIREDELHKMAHNIKKRAQYCINADGGHFGIYFEQIFHKLIKVVLLKSK